MLELIFALFAALFQMLIALFVILYEVFRGLMKFVGIKINLYEEYDSKSIVLCCGFWVFIYVLLYFVTYEYFSKIK